MILALVLMAVIQTSILACLYQGCGELNEEDFSLPDIPAWKFKWMMIHDREQLYSLILAENKQSIIVYIANWLGLVTLMSSDQFIMCGFAIVVSVAQSYPIFRRENASRMYTTAPYFLANTCSNVSINIIYPTLVSLMSFWFFKYPDGGFGGFMLFYMINLISAVMGLCYGQLIGSCVYTEYFALLTLMQTLTIYYLGAGLLINAEDANWLATFF